MHILTLDFMYFKSFLMFHAFNFIFFTNLSLDAAVLIKSDR